MGPIVTTHHAPEIPWWRERATMLDRRTLGARSLIGRLIRDAPRDGALVLEGAVGLQHGYADLVATTVLNQTRAEHVIVLSEVGWEPGSRRLGALLHMRRADEDHLPLQRLARFIVRRLDGPYTYYCVLARRELETFPRVWGVPRDRVRFTPFFHLIVDDVDDVQADDGSVFAGGDSLRDYEPLVHAAAALGAPVYIATSLLADRALPQNVDAGPVSPEEFYGRMRRARVVVVPLASGRIRAAGLLTYLNAMAMGKLVVVTDSVGVRDYVEDGLTGLVVPECDPGALAEALRWALDPAHDDEVRGLGGRARQHVRSAFTVEAYLERLLRIAEEGMERRAADWRRRNATGVPTS
jgi:glycosyltransferase involved in cell wall biosynthesis